MTIKKFRRIVRYFILKHQEEILCETVKKGIKYCNSKRPPAIRIMSHRDLKDLYLKHRDKLNIIIKKYIKIDSEVMIKSLFSMASNNYTSDKAMYAYAEDIMKFINEPSLENIAGLDPLSHDGDKKIYLLYMSKPDYGYIDAEDITNLNIGDLIRLMNRFNLMKLLDTELHNSGKELLKAVLDKKKDAKIIENIDKYIPDDLIDISNLIDVIIELKLYSPSFDTDELRPGAYRRLIERYSFESKDRDMVETLICYSLELMPEKFKNLLIGDMDWFLDVSIDGLSSNLYTIIDTTRINRKMIQDMESDINDHIDNAIKEVIKQKKQ